MAHALIEFGTKRVRFNNLTIEASIASISHYTRSNEATTSDAIGQWITRWEEQILLYGVACFHLELDELLKPDKVRAEFVELLTNTKTWVIAQGEHVPALIIHNIVGGEHWLHPKLHGWSTKSIGKLLTDLKNMIEEQN